MSHSKKDKRKSRGGHAGSWIASGDGGDGWTPGWRRFAKRRHRREERREAAKTICDALRMLAADVAEDEDDEWKMELDEAYYDFIDYTDGSHDEYHHAMYDDEGGEDYYDDFFQLYEFPEPYSPDLAKLPSWKLRNELIRRGEFVPDNVPRE